MIARCVPRRNGKRSVHFFALAPMMVAALFLLSCADHPPNSDAQQKEDKAAAMAAAKDTATIDDARCQSVGFQPGTSRYDQCRKDVNNERKQYGAAQ